MKPANFREVFSTDDGRAVLPELPMVGWTRLDRIRVPGLDAHAHPGMFEIFLIERGDVEWWVEQESLRVPVNHLYLNRPGERHGSLGHGLKPCGYFWFQLHPIPGVGLPGLAPDASAKLLVDLHQLHLRSFPATPATRAAFRALWETHDELPSRHAETCLRAHLHLLLVHILQSHAAAEKTAHSGGSGHHSYAIAQALRLIETHPAEISSVAELAASARLGQSQFAERFFAETGCTPAHYLRVQRIKLAKQLMRAGGLSLTEVAHASGYSSSQHFATIFKRFEGMTPSTYLQRQDEPERISVTPLT